MGNDNIMMWLYKNDYTLFAFVHFSFSFSVFSMSVCICVYVCFWRFSSVVMDVYTSSFFFFHVFDTIDFQFNSIRTWNEKQQRYSSWVVTVKWICLTTTIDKHLQDTKKEPKRERKREKLVCSFFHQSIECINVEERKSIDWSVVLSRLERSIAALSLPYSLSVNHLNDNNNFASL